MVGEAHWFKKLEGARDISAFLHEPNDRCTEVRRCETARTPGPPANQFQHTLTDLYSDDFYGMQEVMGDVN
jgi:hypothetical protein